MLFLCETKENISRVYGNELAEKYPTVNKQTLLENAARYESAEEVFSTWDMPVFSEDEIKKCLPRLKAVFYAAGSVQDFAPAFFNCGVRIFSAWAVNAQPVAEFTLAQILLANKGYFQLHTRYAAEDRTSCDAYANSFPGNFNETVGILGAGKIGRLVIELLRPFDLNLLVFDPFLSENEACALGVTKATLQEVFAGSQTISNHLANNPKTVGMLDYSCFSIMRENAAFINTGRGAQVVMQDLCRALREYPARTALLDVTDPNEPLPPKDALFHIPNLFITPHRAGSVSRETLRMGLAMQDEYKRYQSGLASQFEVTAAMLETMA